MRKKTRLDAEGIEVELCGLSCGGIQRSKEQGGKVGHGGKKESCEPGRVIWPAK
jgi:hypothetical protein